MSGVNKVILVGYLGKDPELKTIGNDQRVANFSVATSEKWKDKQGNAQEKTEWHRIVAWGKLAEVCGQYLAKGKQVYIEGKLQTRQYEKDGSTRYSTEIVAQHVTFLGGGGQGGGGQKHEHGRISTGNGGSAPSEPLDYGPPPLGDEDVPF